MNTSTLRQIKHLNPKASDTVNGYTRQHLQLSKQNVHNIPLDVIDVILLFYCNILNFNQQYHGKSIEIVNDTTIKKIDKTGAYAAKDGGWNSCIFGEEIRNIKCNKFDIHIKWKQCIGAFFMGFIYSSSSVCSLNPNILDCNTLLGMGSNQECSVGIDVVYESGGEAHSAF
eukprot:859003_1